MTTETKSTDTPTRYRFDTPRVRLMAFVMVRDFGEAMTIAQHCVDQGDEALAPFAEGDEIDDPELLTIGALKEAADTIQCNLEVAIAETLIRLWMPAGAFFDTCNDTEPWEPCGALADQIVVHIRPGTVSGETRYSHRFAEVTVANIQDLDSDEAAAAFLKDAPRRMVRLKHDRAEVLTREQLAEILG